MKSNSQAGNITPKPAKRAKRTSCAARAIESAPSQIREQKFRANAIDELDQLLSRRAMMQSGKLIRQILSMSNKHAKKIISDQEAQSLRSNQGLFQPMLHLVYKDIVAEHVSKSWNPFTPDAKQIHLLPEFNPDTVDFIIAHPDELRGLFQWLEAFLEFIPSLIAHNFSKIQRAETNPNGVYTDVMFGRTAELTASGIGVAHACEQTLKEFGLSHRSPEGYRKMFNKRLKK